MSLEGRIGETSSRKEKKSKKKRKRYLTSRPRYALGNSRRAEGNGNHFPDSPGLNKLIRPIANEMYLVIKIYCLKKTYNIRQQTRFDAKTDRRATIVIVNLDLHTPVRSSEVQ